MVLVPCQGGGYVHRGPTLTGRLAHVPTNVKSDRPDLDRRVWEGALAGGESTRSKFAEKITRTRFCEEVGIHRNTLKKWEKLGVVRPWFTDILKTRTAIYDQKDVERGKEIAALIRDNPGEMTLRRAVAIVDGQETR